MGFNEHIDLTIFDSDNTYYIPKFKDALYFPKLKDNEKYTFRFDFSLEGKKNYILFENVQFKGHYVNSFELKIFSDSLLIKRLKEIDSLDIDKIKEIEKIYEFYIDTDGLVKEGIIYYDFD